MTTSAIHLFRTKYPPKPEMAHIAYSHADILDILPDDNKSRLGEELIDLLGRLILRLRHEEKLIEPADKNAKWSWRSFTTMLSILMSSARKSKLGTLHNVSETVIIYPKLVTNLLSPPLPLLSR